MAKLTKYSRDIIAQRLLAHRFGDEEKAVQAAWHALADAVYRDVYGRKTIEQMAALPKGWLQECGRISVQFGESGSQFHHCVFDAPRRLQHRHEYGCAKVYAADHPLSRRYAETVALDDALRDARKAVREKARAMLGSVSTIKRLLEIWPEVAPFVKGLGDDGIKTVPAVPVAELNKALNLKNAA